MKKIKIFSIFFILIFSIFPTQIFALENTTNSGIIVDETNDDSLTEFILKRKDRIEEILKNSDNSIDKKYNEISETINSKKNNTEISNEVIINLQNQFEELNQSILEKNKEIEELTAKDSEKIRQEVAEMESKKIELEKKLLIEKNKILVLETEISELEIYKKRYEELVKENRNELLKEREKNLVIYFGIFIVYLIISGFSLRIKNSQKKSIFNVISTIIFIMSIIIFTLVINPGFVIIFIIIAGSMVLAFKDFIVSFIGSILILRKFKIGDLVEIEGKKGKVNSISALNTTLSTETGEIFLLNNFLISKPLKLVEKEDEYSKVKLLVNKSELNKKLEKINNVFQKDDIKFSFTEKDNEKIELEIELTGENITKKIEKIF